MSLFSSQSLVVQHIEERSHPLFHAITGRIALRAEIIEEVVGNRHQLHAVEMRGIDWALTKPREPGAEHVGIEGPIADTICVRDGKTFDSPEGRMGVIFDEVI